MLITGLSGNELYCLAQKGYGPGAVVVGNSVYSLGVARSFTSGFQTLAGGELTSVTELISDGRHAALKRMEEEATRQGAHGLTGVTSDLKRVSGLMEFLAVGSAVKGLDHQGPVFKHAWTRPDLYGRVTACYAPGQFGRAKCGYALGLCPGLLGAFRG